MIDFLKERGYKELSLDSNFRFHCIKCGDCCRNREDIILSPRDLYRLATELKSDTKSVVEAYGEQYIGNESRFPIVRLKPVGKGKDCPLLKSNKCSVHNSKPTVCAMFPLGRMIAENDLEKKITYIFADPKCGSKSETHTVREWLSNFGLAEDDPFFKRWQTVIMKVSEYLRNIEKEKKKSLLNVAWTLTFVQLYLAYDMNKEFEPQFEANIEELSGILGFKI